MHHLINETSNCFESKIISVNWSLPRPEQCSDAIANLVWKHHDLECQYALHKQYNINYVITCNQGIIDSRINFALLYCATVTIAVLHSVQLKIIELVVKGLWSVKQILLLELFMDILCRF